MSQQFAAGRSFASRRQRPVMIFDLLVNALSWSVTFLVVGPIVLPLRSTSTEIALTAGLTAAGWITGWLHGLYSGHIARERTTTTLRLLRSLFVTTMVAALSGVAFNLAAKELIVGVAMLWSITVLGHAFFHARIRVRRARGRDHDRILIVGANEEAASFIDLLEVYPELGLDPVGVVGNAAEASLKGLEARHCGPLLSAADRVRELDARFAVIMTGAIPSGRLRQVLDSLQDTGVELMISTDMGHLHQRRLRSRSIGFAPLFFVDDGSHRAMLLQLKRSVDIVLALIALIVTAPIQVLAWLALRITSRDTVLYRQRRKGLNGTEFDVLRFRTMANEQVQAVPGDAPSIWHDPRLTLLGRLLEVTAVNELPQFWNVLRGDMSIVGPKPGYINLDSEAHVLAMRPGMTGIWRTEANLYPEHAARHQLNDLYVENWSLRLDVGVFVSSIEILMVRLIRGASWRHESRTIKSTAKVQALRARAADSAVA